MRHAFLVTASAVAVVTAGAAFASPLGDAKAGLAAYDKGDNLTAIRLFTAAINSRQLGRSDQELAYVKRGEAYLAAHQEKSALTDANHALDLDPSDSEAAATRDRARALLTPTPAAPVVQRSMATYTPPKADDTPKADDAAKADYAAAVESYEAKKKAASDAYARQMADYDAQVKAEDDRHAADLAAWRRDVEDCKAGMLSKCGKQAMPQPEAAAAPPPKPAVVGPTTVKPATPPAKAPAKTVKKSAPAFEPEPPPIY